MQNKDLDSKCYMLSKAVMRRDFPLQARVMAALNLAEALEEKKDCYAECLVHLSTEAVSVNIENGDVEIDVEKCFQNDISLDGMENYIQCQGGTNTGLEENDFTRFAVYSTFRLLCMENPFDGRETLLEYPLLSKKAIKQIHSGDYGFVMSDCTNRFSDYIGREILPMWKNVPIFLKEVFEQELNVKQKDLDCLSMKEWVKYMRMLRDCLVCVNNQFRLCDPDAKNDVLFMVVNGFKIPVWPRKAIYWYHVDEEKIDMQKGGIIGGINTKGLLENRTSGRWYVEDHGQKIILYSDCGIKPENGMKIYIGCSKIEIVSGM